MARFFLCLLGVILMSFSSLQAGGCSGKFVNPITDICWKCVFPLRIMGFEVVKGGPDPNPVKDPICLCKRPPIPVPLPGIPISFWEPVRLVDVTRVPYCLVNLGGLVVGPKSAVGHGVVHRNEDDGTHSSFYHVHWYIYPLLYWLEVLMDFLCLDAGTMDLAYITELDPFWADDEKSAILNPEGVLFGNPIAQAACAADCIKATTDLPFDTLFWCGGCLGSLYPFGGHVTEHQNPLQTSTLVAMRMMAKLHRQGLLWGYVGKEGLCSKYPMPIIQKTQYRIQMTYPIPQTQTCLPLGHTDVTWHSGKHYPYQGEDFGYLVWRKRDCCLL